MFSGVLARLPPEAPPRTAHERSSRTDIVVTGMSGGTAITVKDALAVQTRIKYAMHCRKNVNDALSVRTYLS